MNEFGLDNLNLGVNNLHSIIYSSNLDVDYHITI
jgi:hypothetical protein